MLRVVDMFSGIGGFSIGMERAGAETIAFCEVDDYASRVLEKQWPTVPNIRGGVLALALKWEHVDFDRRVIRFRDTEAAEDRSKKRRGNKPMDDELFALLERAKEATPDGCDYVINWRGKGIKNAYHAMRALFKRAGLDDLRTHDLRRSSATYVHNETDGDIAKAASHIVDTEATARKHYVQEDPRVHMPAMSAVANVLSRARGGGVTH